MFPKAGAARGRPARGRRGRGPGLRLLEAQPPKGFEKSVLHGAGAAPGPRAPSPGVPAAAEAVVFVALRPCDGWRGGARSPAPPPRPPSRARGAGAGASPLGAGRGRPAVGGTSAPQPPSSHLRLAAPTPPPPRRPSRDAGLCGRREAGPAPPAPPAPTAPRTKSPRTKSARPRSRGSGGRPTPGAPRSAGASVSQWPGGVPAADTALLGLCHFCILLNQPAKNILRKLCCLYVTFFVRKSAP